MDRLQKLQDLFLRNLRVHRPSAERPICPICMREMPSDGDSNARVTEGHVYPEGTGIDGGCVVECWRCNHTLGGLCDQDFVQQLRIERFYAGDRSYDVLRGLFGNPGANLRVDGQLATAHVSVVGGKPHLSVSVRGSVQIPENGSLQFSYEFAARDFLRSLVAVLHAAYLRMFYLFGYEYVFNPNMAPLRADLSRLGSGAIPRNRVAQEFARYRKTITLVDSLMDKWQWPHAVSSPPGARTFIAIVRTLPGRCALVSLPGFGREGRKAYERMLNRHPRQLSCGNVDVCALKVTKLSREERLCNADFRGFAKELWQQAGSHRSSLRKAVRKLDARPHFVARHVVGSKTKSLKKN